MGVIAWAIVRRTANLRDVSSSNWLKVKSTKDNLSSSYRPIALCSQRCDIRACIAALSSVTASLKHVSQIRQKRLYRQT